MQIRCERTFDQHTHGLLGHYFWCFSAACIDWTKSIRFSACNCLSSSSLCSWEDLHDRWWALRPLVPLQIWQVRMGSIACFSQLTFEAAFKCGAFKFHLKSISFNFMRYCSYQQLNQIIKGRMGNSLQSQAFRSFFGSYLSHDIKIAII